MVRSILFVTGTRADFGKLEPLAVAARDQGLRVSFFVTGMHMLKQYGMTKIEVHRIEGIEVHEFLNQRVGDPQDQILAKTVVGFSDYCAEQKPDLVVIHGDRIEALACAIVCSTNYIRCAHIEGGEVSGSIDEVFRHCNSKLSNYHFVSSNDAKRRVSALGESESSIYVIGSPELDFHSKPSGVTIEEVKARYDIPYDDYGIVIFHPVTSESRTIHAQAQSVYAELMASGKCFVVIAPNNDPGANAILSVMEILPRDRFRVLPSMRFGHFSELMRNAAVMIGNSSAGVREAPFLGIPSLDVGSRQTNRAKAASITHVSAYDRSAIAAFLASCWGKRYPRYDGFSQGGSADRFIEILLDNRFWKAGLQKLFME